MVWGARGFFGSHLVPRLLSEGWNVTVVSRAWAYQATHAWRDDVHWVKFDPDRPDSEALVAAIKPASVIFNLSGSSGAVASNRTPIASLDGTCRLQLQFLDACRQARSRPHVVFASSRLVYGRTPPLAVAEDFPVAPASMYAAHKLCIEHYLRIAAARGDLTFTILRISNAFGPDPESMEKPYGVINTMIARALAGEAITVFGDGRQQRDYLYVPDLIEVMIASLSDRARNGLFNIGRGVGISFVDAATLIRQRAGAPPLSFAPWPPEFELVESGDYVSDINKARGALGFDPQYDFEEGLDDLFTRVRASVVRRDSRTDAPVAALAPTGPS